MEANTLNPDQTTPKSDLVPLRTKADERADDNKL